MKSVLLFSVALLSPTVRQFLCRDPEALTTLGLNDAAANALANGSPSEATSTNVLWKETQPIESQKQVCYCAKTRMFSLVWRLAWFRLSLGSWIPSLSF